MQHVLTSYLVACCSCPGLLACNLIRPDTEMAPLPFCGETFALWAELPALVQSLLLLLRTAPTSVHRMLNAWCRTQPTMFSETTKSLNRAKRECFHQNLRRPRKCRSNNEDWYVRRAGCWANWAARVVLAFTLCCCGGIGYFSTSVCTNSESNKRFPTHLTSKKR